MIGGSLYGFHIARSMRKMEEMRETNAQLAHEHFEGRSRDVANTVSLCLRALGLPRDVRRLVARTVLHTHYAWEVDANFPLSPLEERGLYGHDKPFCVNMRERLAKKRRFHL